MRKRNKSLLFLLLLILLFLLLLLSLPLLFPDLFKEGTPAVSTELQAQTAVQEQVVEQPVLNKHSVSEALVSFRSEKKQKQLYERVSQGLISRGLTKEDLNNLNEDQKVLLNQIVAIYNQVPVNEQNQVAYEDWLPYYRRIEPLEKQLLQALGLPKIQPVSSESSSSSETVSTEESTMKKVMDFTGALMDALHGSLKKTVPFVPLVGGRRLAF